MRYQPLSREEVRSVIEGRGAAARVPVLLHFWTHPEEFGDRTPAVQSLMDSLPQDVQVIPVRMPSVADAPPEDPPYRWLTSASGSAGLGRTGPDGRTLADHALDAQALIADWDELDAVLEDFPDPRSPLALPENPAPDGRYRLASWWYCLFERHWSLRGMTNALLDFGTDPGQVHRLYRALTDFYLGLIDRIGTEVHADGVLTSDDIGMQTGPFFSASFFEEFFAPYYRELAQRAHAHGMHLWLHACGNIEPFLPRLIDLGIDVIHPIQKYAMDETRIAKIHGGRVRVWAGFDVQRIIPFGTAAEVRAEVRHLMDTWHRPEGRFMFTAGNGINGDCAVESLRALYDEAYSYGRTVVEKVREK